MLRVVILTLSALVGVFLLLGIIGVALIETGVIEDPDDADPAAPTTSMTTTAPTTTTTTTAPTTTEAPTEAAVSAALQEMFADMTEQDCAEEVVGYGDDALVMSDTLTAMVEDIEAGRLFDAETRYWQLGVRATMALDDYALWMEVCAPKSSPALVAEVETFTPMVQEGWNALEAACLAELAALGWPCSDFPISRRG